MSLFVLPGVELRRRWLGDLRAANLLLPSDTVNEVGKKSKAALDLTLKVLAIGNTVDKEKRGRWRLPAACEAKLNFRSRSELAEDIRKCPIALRNSATNRRSKALVRTTAVVA